ncbi:MAG: HEAT repeat domain-containing protein [Aeromicrobium sp.]|uniref:HEAT repeat domain-containing protein n=1 Tax=Aeromicrobium sp. TaxID=1871063 RepID=UPI0039E27987
MTALAEAALDEPHPSVAETLYGALARAGDEPVPTLADALDSPDPARRRRAVEALEKIDTLARALDHDGPPRTPTARSP